MSFKDGIDNTEYVLQLCFADYAGDIITVNGSDQPIKVTTEGDEDNLFDTIHSSKIEINFFQDEFVQELYDDVNNLTDKQCYVKLDSDKFTWRGWLIPTFSKKSFNKAFFNQSLQAVDFFTYLKSVKAVDGDGKIIYGKKSLIYLLDNAFSKALTEPFEYEAYTDLTIYPNAVELQGHNILEQLSIAAESLNDSEGRPPYCYDVIKGILHGMGLVCYFKGEKVIITDFVSQDTPYREIGIKQHGSDINILIEDDEVITNVRAAKEISAEFKYNRATGILPDGFFSDWTDGLLNQWLWNNKGYIAQDGTGRSESPYGVKLTTHATEISGVNFEDYSILRNTPYNHVLLSDSSYTIDFNVRYQDWRAWGKTNLPNPQLQFGMLLEGASGKQYELWQENGYTKDQSLWVETTKDGSGNYVVDKDTFYTGGSLHTRRSISLDSTAARQKLSYSIPALPENGTVYVYIQSAFLSPDIADLPNNEGRSDLIYYSVILSENLSVNANGVGGEKHYLTNYGDYSLIEETETFEMETGLNESVAGAIYNAIEFNITGPVIEAGNYPVGTQMNFIAEPGATFLGHPVSLIKAVMKKRMYYKRFPNSRIDLKIRSNTLQFGDFIKLIEGDQELMPDLYIMMNNVFYPKTGRHECTVIQLKGNYRNAPEGSAPSPAADSYEFYYETND